MKKNTKILTITLFIAVLFFFTVQFSFAAYTPMEEIPGFEGDATDFPSYIMQIYKFAIWTVGIAALLMITIGGFMYFTSAGNTSKLSKAKTILTDSILGVILALGAYMLLNVINPDLVGNDISSVSDMRVVSDEGLTSYTPRATPVWPPNPIPFGTFDDAAARAILGAMPAPITVAAAKCPAYLAAGCVDLDGIPERAVDGLKRIAIETGIGLNVTGGTEWWLHLAGTNCAAPPCESTNGPEKPVLDVAVTGCPPAPALCTAEQLLLNMVSHGALPSSYCASTMAGGARVECTDIGADRFHLIF